jgi:hypothetical protein
MKFRNLLIVALAGMPWLILLIMNMIPSGMSFGEAYRLISVLFGMVLWPLVILLTGGFLSLLSDVQMAKLNASKDIDVSNFNGI